MVLSGVNYSGVILMKQFLTFAGIGAIGTAGHYVTLLILVEVFFIKPVLATTLGFVVGALINYFLNYKYTFNSDKPHMEALLKFLAVATIGAVLNSMIMYLGIRITELNYIIIQVFATGVVLLWNFLLNKF